MVNNNFNSINKNIEHYNFIAIYDGFFSDSLCKNLITYFDWCCKYNKIYGRAEPQHIKNDLSANINPKSIEQLNFSTDHLSGYLEEFNDVFWSSCYKDYISKYSVLTEHDRHTINCYKVQKTMPTQGYHLWHSENTTLETARRLITYTLYLNDVEQGGETEFLYLSKRVLAKQGRLLLFPPNYPWAHRGNPPLSGNKYIMTGWIEFV